MGNACLVRKAPPRRAFSASSGGVSAEFGRVYDPHNMLGETGGYIDIVLLDLSTTAHVLMTPTWLHEVLQQWFSFWLERDEAIPCMVCGEDTAAHGEISPAVVLLQAAERVLDAADHPEAPEGASHGIATSVMLHGMCARCAGRDSIQRDVYEEVRSHLFPSATRVDPIHFAPGSGTA